MNVGLPRCGARPRTPAGLADLARAPGPRGPRRHGLRGPRQWLVADRAAAWPATTQRDGAAARRAHADVGGDARLGRRHRHLRTQHRGHRDPGRLLRADGHRLRRSSTCRSAQALSVLGHGHLGRPARLRRRRRRAQGARHGPRQPHDPRRGRCGSAPTSTHVRAGPARVRVGDRVRVLPAHVDPTVALHERMYLVRRRRPCWSAGRSTCAAGEAYPAAGSSRTTTHFDVGVLLLLGRSSPAGPAGWSPGSTPATQPFGRRVLDQPEAVGAPLHAVRPTR